MKIYSIRKWLLLVVCASLSVSFCSAQSWVNCNEILLTVDDFNTDLDFSNQPVNCGCNNNSGECTLVRIKLVETINGIESPVEYSSIGFMPPLSPPLEVNYIQKDYIDIYNPYFQCQEYQSQGLLNHSYRFSPVAPAGHEMHLLVCPGSETGQMRGRFTSVTPGSSIPAATNVQASDGQSGISVSFDSQPGKYYMAYRSTERCNETWVPIDPSMPWPQASGATMTIAAQSFIPNQQLMYRVVVSDQGFVVATDTEGAWSEGDLGHYGSTFDQYDVNNFCSMDCSGDITDPIINCPIVTLPIEIQTDGTASASFVDFNITATDDCDTQVDISDINFNLDCSHVGGPALYNTVFATDDSRKAKRLIKARRNNIG
ncbi:MAG: hypothetical protein ACJATI_001044 [Halioglobus sp.]|jgi:hypothetical protein